MLYYSKQSNARFDVLLDGVFAGVGSKVCMVGTVLRTHQHRTPFTYTVHTIFGNQYDV